MVAAFFFSPVLRLSRFSGFCSSILRTTDSNCCLSTFIFIS